MKWVSGWLLLLCLLQACVSQESPERSDEWWIAQHVVLDPALTVANASQWYELEHGVWPEQLADVADLAEELGHALREPPEPILIPDAGHFRKLRFEIVSDSIMRLHFDLAPFEVEELEADTMLGEVPQPAMSVKHSQGIISLRHSDSGFAQRKVWIQKASVTSASGQEFEFLDESFGLQPLVFLEPIPREGYPLR